MGKKIMIVGANFGDKGSQARLYIVIDELRKRFSDCQVYYAHNDEQLDGALYRFGKISFTKRTQSQVLKSNPLRSITKMFHKKDDSAAADKDVADLVSEMDLIVDVSEHVLSDKSSIADIEYYMNNIKIAKKFKIPMIIMPQSFGPFNFSVDNMYIMGPMQELLFYPKAIYCREQFGYDEMIGYFGLDNLRRSRDMLLVDNNFDVSNVCSRFYRSDIPEIPEGNNVAVIPNSQYFSKKDFENRLDLYKMIFEALKDAKKNAYIVCQASADMDICKDLADHFRHIENVHLIERELDCIEFNTLLTKFDFIISSHFEACVEAYRHFIPVISVGTGECFKELMEPLGQENLFFDVSIENYNNFDVIDALNGMIKDPDISKTRILTRTMNIQTENSFDVFDELKW